MYRVIHVANLSLPEHMGEEAGAAMDVESGCVAYARFSVLSIRPGALKREESGE